jgi:hypothetical protein
MIDPSDPAMRRQAAADSYRRLEAKRRNEELRLVATSFDRLSTVILGGAVLGPLFQHMADDLLEALSWFFAALVLHCVARYLTRCIRSEE